MRRLSGGPKPLKRATASLNGLTQTYMELEQYEEAIKYYKMWLEAEPDNTQSQEELAKAQAALAGR